MPVNYVDTIGKYGEGNINLNKRIVVHNPDGTFSTEKSFSVEIDNKEVLLPTIIYGREYTENDAITHYLNTGEYLGKFNSVADAENYSVRLHERQEWYYTVGAFNGKLLELKIGGSYTEFPTNLINAESYKVTPDQRLEASANRAASGKLIRSTLSHTASKIELNTTVITQRDLKIIEILLTNAYTDPLQRKLELRYYVPADDEYKTGMFYVPDVDYDILRIEKDKNIVWYNSVRYAFIEY